MGKNRFTRMLALCLATVCLVSVVSALSFDLNDDKKTDVWDLQLAVTGENEAIFADVLAEALGGGDELNLNANGAYEIYSAMGLYNMAMRAKEGASFELKADIDLSGTNWEPIVGFCGQFNGNGHTISNVTIKTSVAGDTGFFAYLDRYTVNGETVQSVVKNLKLENVNITAEATADAQFIGLLSGSNRGVVENCTTTGSVADNRTTFVDKDGKTNVYVGTLVGRNNDHETMAGLVKSGSYTLTATAGSPNSSDKVTGLVSKMAMFFNDEATFTHKVGVAGYSKASVKSLQWQDTTGSVTYKSQTEQERRQSVVDHMYMQGTVQWTTSETLIYTAEENKNHIHSTIYIAGRTYTGIPYNGSGTSYEHFLAQMQSEKDNQGRYVTVTGLEDGTNSKTGFAAYMGNDCSSAVGWAWASVMPSRVANSGVRVNTTPYMVPTAYNVANYGVYPAGGYQMIESNTENDIGGRDTRSIIEFNGGAEKMAEYYAKASRGDALLFVEYEYNAETEKWEKDGGHARMLAYDPVIIRYGNGAVDMSKSYVITHEQGDGLMDNRNLIGNYETSNGYPIKYTSWRTNHKYTLSVLLTEKGYQDAKDSFYWNNPGCGYGYVPVTVTGFSYEEDFREPYFDPGYSEHPVSQPNNGWYYSNYRIVNATMRLTDAQGNEVYNKTAFTPCTLRGSIYQTLKLDELFADADDNLVEGQTYYETLTILSSNGQTITKWNNKAFTYTVAETTN